MLRRLSSCPLLWTLLALLCALYGHRPSLNPERAHLAFLQVSLFSACFLLTIGVPLSLARCRCGSAHWSQIVGETTLLLMLLAGLTAFLAYIFPNPLTWPSAWAIGAVLLTWIGLLYGLGFFLSSVGLSSSTVTLVLLTSSSLLMAHLFLCGPLLMAVGEKWRACWISFLLHTSPWIAISSCFPRYDLLRACEFFYQYCPIATCYPFVYPRWPNVAGLYGLAGMLFFLASLVGQWLLRRRTKPLKAATESRVTPP